MARARTSQSNSSPVLTPHANTLLCCAATGSTWRARSAGAAIKNTNRVDCKMSNLRVAVAGIAHSITMRKHTRPTAIASLQSTPPPPPLLTAHRNRHGSPSSDNRKKNHNSNKIPTNWVILVSKTGGARALSSCRRMAAAIRAWTRAHLQPKQVFHTWGVKGWLATHR